jgi:hypothetical protein
MAGCGQEDTFHLLDIVVAVYWPPDSAAKIKVVSQFYFTPVMEPGHEHLTVQQIRQYRNESA